MKLIPRYINRQLFKATLFTLIALIGIYSLFEVINEVSRVGQGSYTISVMLSYIALLTPTRAYEIMPLAVLIGGMITMSQLASHSEYTIIRTSGVSIYQIGFILLKFGLIFAIIALTLGEFIAPNTQELGQRLRLDAINKSISIKHKSSIWVKDNNHFINIGILEPGGDIRSLKVYKYNEKNELQESMFAQHGHFLEYEGVWQLNNVSLSKFSPDKISVQNHKTYRWKSIIEPNILNVLLVVPEQMSALDLGYYISHLHKNQQQTRRYEIALWGKLFYPLACVSMALIALAFTPRQRRQSALGVRLFFGICLGIGFHFFNRFCGYLGLLYAWNPVLVSTIPTLLFLVAGLFIISRQERR